MNQELFSQKLSVAYFEPVPQIFPTTLTNGPIEMRLPVTKLLSSAKGTQRFR